MNDKRIVIVDGNETYRIGIRTVLNATVGLTVVGEASTVAELLLRLDEWKADLLVLEPSSLDGELPATLAAIREVSPEIRVFIHSDTFSRRLLAEALFRGVHGFTTKSISADLIVTGISAVLRDDLFVHAHGPARAELPGPLSLELLFTSGNGGSLTRREREVLGLVMQGTSSREIAGCLFISARTVENHRSNIMRKLGVRTQVELFRYAARFGLVDI